VRQAVILAGGKGTRLASRWPLLPKPLVPVAGVSLIERQVLSLKSHGFEEILVLVNHRSELVRDFCLKNNNWGISIKCVDDGEKRQGTAGAVLNVFDMLDSEFLVVYGDTVFEIDLTRLIEFFAVRREAVGVIFVHPNDHPQDSDVVELDGQSRVLGFHPYPRKAGEIVPNMVSAALYVLTRAALGPFLKLNGELDFGKHLFPSMLENNQKIFGYLSSEYIKDAGTPERLDKVERDLLSGYVRRASLRVPQKAVFVDRDGTLNHDVGYISKVDQLTLIPGVGEAVQRLNRHEWRVVVVTNQPVLARGECDEVTLKRIHWKLETEIGLSGAFFDRVYYCPHHPDAGFPGEVAALKYRCDCRKPEPGLLRRAELDLNLDLFESWLIGDSDADIGAAQNAGVTSILIDRSRERAKERVRFLPDFVVNDLAEGVAFILDEYPALLERNLGTVGKIKMNRINFVESKFSDRHSVISSISKRELQRLGITCQIVNLNERNDRDSARNYYRSFNPDLVMKKVLDFGLDDEARFTQGTSVNASSVNSHNNNWDASAVGYAQKVVIYEIEGAAQLAKFLRKSVDDSVF